jgi:thiol-disulfide isomerase/thioredoxin
MVNKRKNSDVKKYIKDNFFWISFVIVVLVLGFLIVLTNETKEYPKIEDVDFSKNVTMEVFHSETCGYCIRQAKYEKYLVNKYPQLILIKYDVTKQKTRELWKKYQAKYPRLANSQLSTPISIINQKNELIENGYGGPEKSGARFDSWIKSEIENLKNE